MLRDVPPFRQDFDESYSVFAMSPGLGVNQDHDSHTNADMLDDVFGSAPSSPRLLATGGSAERDRLPGQRRPSAEISDIHRLRSTHVTSGYREGIAASKERYMQEGFDEGYNLGAELGLKVGWCLGALQGMWHALKPDMTTNSSIGTNTKPDRDEVAKTFFEAEKQLDMQRLYASDYFGVDGIWLYDVKMKEANEHEVTFDEIAAAHPVVKEWSQKVKTIAEDLGLLLE